VKASKVQLRLRPAQKAVIARAAQLRRTSLSNFMLEHAYDGAQQVLAEQVDSSCRRPSGTHSARPSMPRPVHPGSQEAAQASKRLRWTKRAAAQ